MAIILSALRGLLVPFLLLSLFTQCQNAEPQEGHRTSKAQIQLMTSLPIIWGDGASVQSVLDGHFEAAPIYRYWQDHYDMVPLDSLENLQKSNPSLVILAQPRAMDPADLDELDEWIRNGGDSIILVDPQLAWHSHYAIGDNRRPLQSSLLSPLLKHWGLELTVPENGHDQIAEIELGDNQFQTVGVGRLEQLNEQSEDLAICTGGENRFFLTCQLGRGRVSIIADADFLDAGHWPEDVQSEFANSGAVRFFDEVIQSHTRAKLGQN